MTQVQRYIGGFSRLSWVVSDVITDKIQGLLSIAELLGIVETSLLSGLCYQIYHRHLGHSAYYATCTCTIRSWAPLWYFTVSSLVPRPLSHLLETYFTFCVLHIMDSERNCQSRVTFCGPLDWITQDYELCDRVRTSYIFHAAPSMVSLRKDHFLPKQEFWHD